MSYILDFCTELPVRTFQGGETVLHENQKDGRLYVLRRGVVTVKKRDTEVNRLSSPGSLFGEVALLLHLPHGAEVVAEEPSELYIIEDGISFLAENPEMTILVAKLLAQRLKNMTDEMVELREQLDADEVASSQFGGIIDRMIGHYQDREF